MCHAVTLTHPAFYCPIYVEYSLTSLYISEYTKHKLASVVKLQ